MPSGFSNNSVKKRGFLADFPRMILKKGRNGKGVRRVASWDWGQAQDGMACRDGMDEAKRKLKMIILVFHYA